MGFMFMVAECYACHGTFNSNPELVPSFQGQPICRPCIEKVNTNRRERGLKEWPVLPGAYEMQEVDV